MDGVVARAGSDQRVRCSVARVVGLESIVLCDSVGDEKPVLEIDIGWMEIVEAGSGEHGFISLCTSRVEIAARRGRYNLVDYHVSQDFSPYSTSASFIVLPYGTTITHILLSLNMSSALIPLAVDLKKISSAISSNDQSLLEALLKQYQNDFACIDELANELDEDDETEVDETDDESDNRASLLELSKLLGSVKKNLETGSPPDQLLSQSKNIAPNHLGMLKDLLGDDDEASSASDTSSSTASAADVMRHLITGNAPAHRVAHQFKYGYALQFLCQHLGEQLPNDQWRDLHGSTWAAVLDKALKSVKVPGKTLSISKHLAARGAPLKQIPRYNDAPAIGYLQGKEVERALKALNEANLDSLDKESQLFLQDIRTWLQTCADLKLDFICFST